MAASVHAGEAVVSLYRSLSTAFGVGGLLAGAALSPAFAQPVPAPQPVEAQRPSSSGSDIADVAIAPRGW